MKKYHIKLKKGIPKVVATISSKGAIASVLQIPLHERDFDIVEIRLDTIGHYKDWIKDLKKLEASDIPVLLTIRNKGEGGAWEDTLNIKRRDLFIEAINNGAVSMVDLEVNGDLLTKSLADTAKRHGVRILVSVHHFHGTPSLSALKIIVKKGIKFGADIVKIATKVCNEKDKRNLTKLLVETEFPLCVIGMGTASSDTRIIFPCLGSVLTYGYLDKASAPGQYSTDILDSLLRQLSPKYNQEVITKRQILEYA